MQDVIPALHEEGKLWIAYPKAASKIVSDLNRECSWTCIRNNGFESIHETCLDHVWSAIRFQRMGLPLRGMPIADLEADCMETVESVSSIPMGTVRGFGKIARRI
jgi:hypothetical protein